MTTTPGALNHGDGELPMTVFSPRKNLVERTSERWKPQPHSKAFTRPGRTAATLRGLFDLQFGSVSNDVSKFLQTVTGRLLDVGCGDQPFRHLVPDGVEYTGIDRAETLGSFEYRNSETRYFTGDRWPVPNEGYDALICTEVLEHVPDPAAFLSEAHRCLVPGGRIFLTVPFAARWHYIPHDYWRYTPSCLDRLLAANGFERIEVYSRGNELTVACYKTMALILPFLFPQRSSQLATIARRSVGLFCFPAFVALALVANLSLRYATEADDSLGYTVLAVKCRAPVQDQGPSDGPPRQQPEMT
jgi:SAM-dependent methyltransferase